MSSARIAPIKPMGAKSPLKETQMRSRKIRINPDGSLECLYSDSLPFADEFKLIEITRAANVEFNNHPDKKCWEVISMHGDTLASGFKKRQDAINKEIEIVESSL